MNLSHYDEQYECAVERGNTVVDCNCCGRECTLTTFERTGGVCRACDRAGCDGGGCRLDSPGEDNFMTLGVEPRG